MLREYVFYVKRNYVLCEGKICFLQRERKNFVKKKTLRHPLNSSGFAARLWNRDTSGCLGITL